MPERLPKTFTRWVYDCPQCGALAWRTEEGEGRNRGRGPQRPPSPGADLGQTRRKVVECPDCVKMEHLLSWLSVSIADKERRQRDAQDRLTTRTKASAETGRRVCATCGRELAESGRTDRASYCSAACRQAHYRARKRAAGGALLSTNLTTRRPGLLGPDAPDSAEIKEPQAATKHDQT